jgi:hypothetical protein
MWFNARSPRSHVALVSRDSFQSEFRRIRLTHTLQMLAAHIRLSCCAKQVNELPQ